MLNMFGRDYEEIGSSDKGLILKSSGKIKILWGKKLFDLLDSDGNLNIKFLQIIKKVSSEKGIKEDGFYFYNGNLIAKVGDDIIEFTNETSGNIYVSFIEEQKTTDEQKYTALKNIGLVYSSIDLYNDYPKNGIIYVEDVQKLFIVSNGNLFEYYSPIPNPYPKLFVIAKEDTDDSEGALIIEGDGRNNSLNFNNIKIYSRGETSIIEFNKELYFLIGNTKLLTVNSTGIETNGIKSDNGDSEHGYRIYEDLDKYVLDIDRINVRDGLFADDYFDDEFYSENFKIDLFTPILSGNNISYIIFTTNIMNKNSNISNNALMNNCVIEIPMRVIPCTLSGNTLSSTSTVGYFKLTYDKVDNPNNIREIAATAPLEQIFRFRFRYTTDRLYFIDEYGDRINVSYGKATYTKDLLIYEYIIIQGNVFIFRHPKISNAFRQRSGYVVSKWSLDYRRIRMDFRDPDPMIALQLNKNDDDDELKTIVRIGDIREFRTYSDYPKKNGVDVDYNGVFSASNVFIGGEFRHIDKKTQPLYYMYPRYSLELTKGMNETIFNHDDIILPKKWVPQAANYIEDLSAFGSGNSVTLETRDDNLYQGKLFLYKITGDSSNYLSVRFKLSPRYDILGNRINDQYTNYFDFYDRGNQIKEDYYRQNTIILALYDNGVINVLRNPGIISIQKDGIELAKEPNFYDINFLDSNNIDINVTFNSSTKTININADISQTLEQRLLDIESDISDIKSDISDILSDISGIQSDISDIQSDISDILSDISGMLGDISNIQSDISGILGDISNILGDISGLDGRLRSVEAHFLS